MTVAPILTPTIPPAGAVDHRPHAGGSVGSIAESVQLAATATTRMAHDASPEGERAVSLIEVSFALHRAALTLADLDLRDRPSAVPATRDRRRREVALRSAGSRG